MPGSGILDHPNAIAIVGMAGRFPGARNVEEFWKNLRNGVESISTFTPEELDASGVDPSVLDDPIYVNRSGVLDHGDCFDAAFFGYHPREAALMDPQQRVFLECAWAALEAAGYDPEAYEGLIGVFGGVARNTYFLYNAEVYRDLYESGAGYQAMLASDKDYVATRVSFKLNLRGPGINVQSACSTSGVAVHLASQSLLSGDCDMALAGGGRIRVPLRAGYHYVEGGIPSPDGHCRAFDEQAQGCVYGSGMAILVLKRLADAVRDGDHVHAVLRGSAINNDGSAKIGFTAPSVQGQAAVIEDALAVADLGPDEISYVEAHGTGTTLGDPIEVAALGRAFQRRRQGLDPILVGSVKTNIGHLDAGAAAAGIIKTALALEHGEIPASLHFHRPNPQIDFANTPVRVNPELRDWPRGQEPRRAGVSAFGLGGTNFHGVLEEAPVLETSGPSRSSHLFLLSARTPESLERLTADLAEHLGAHPNLNLADAAYTLQVGRRRFPHRRALVAGNRDEAVSRLAQPKPPAVVTEESQGTERPVAFMFTGQGAQHANMGRGLYETEARFRDEVDRCAAILEPEIGADIRAMLFPPSDRVAWADEQLKQTAFTQPALFTLEYALAALWRSWGIEPKAMIGHSIGEYVAACLSGVFSVEGSLRLVAARGQLMGSMPEGSMLAVSLPEGELADRLDERLSLAVLNAVNSSVASGPHDAVDELEERLSGEGIACRRLRTSHAFHSSMMDPILGPFTDVVREASPRPPSIPFVSNVTGTWITEPEATDPTYWARQLRSAVRFSDGLKTLFGDADTILLEVGPGRTLTTLARQHPEKGAHRAIIQSLRHPSEETPDQSFVLGALGRLWAAGASTDWSRFYEGETRRRVPLPTYSFERTRHWLKTSRKKHRDGGAEEGPGELQTEVGEWASGRPEDEELSAEIHTPRNRREALELELQRLFSELTGVRVSEIPAGSSFLELGFESLILTQACARIRRSFSVDVTLGQLLDELGTAASLAEYMDVTLPEEAYPELLQVSGPPPGEPVTAPSEEVSVEPGSGMKESPLTDGQQEIWLAAQMGEDGSCAFNLSNTLRLKGKLDLERLKMALAGLVARHEALRGTVHPRGTVLRIPPSLTLQTAIIDLSSLDESGRNERVAQLQREDVETPFDLENGPLVRPTIIRLAQDDHLLFLSVHHIVADGWSSGVLVRELGEIYKSLAHPEHPALPPAVQFSDYARWYQAAKSSPEAEEAESYWVSQFEDLIPVLDLPTDHTRPAFRTYNANRLERLLDPSLVEGLRRVSVGHGTTLFTVLLTAFEVLLHRLTGQNDLVIGVSAAGQANYGAQSLVGHCVNFLPLRMKAGPPLAFQDRLREVRETVSQGFRYQICSYGSLLQTLKIHRDPSRVPLVPVVFNLGAVRPIEGFEGMEVIVGSNPRRYENFEIFANVVETGDSLEVQWTYNRDLFDAGTIDRWLTHYVTLLANVVRAPSESIGRLPILREEERETILQGWNATEQEYDSSASIQSLFEAQAELAPEKVAVTFGDNTLTYGELETRANQLARCLTGEGVGSGKLVGVCLERSEGMLVAILGVLKAGGAYLPLDPAFPRDRLEFMISDAHVDLLLTESALAQDLPSQMSLVCLDSDWPRISEEGEDRPVGPVGGEDLAYVIYTSGSTGRPKGVQVPHRAVVNFLNSMAREPGLGPRDILLAVTTLSFDISVLELLLPLTTGASIVVASKDVAADGRALLNALRESGPTVIQATPATWRILLEAGWEGDEGLKVLVGGEALPRDLGVELVRRAKEVWNMYGPTETTVWSTCWRVQNPERGVLIGRPIGNTQVYVLDSELQPLPAGVVGELFIAGDGVTLGYLNRPELTAERFVPLPTGEEPRRTMYRTGDLARYTADGSIECLGRMDNQVKVRGFRIELGEIEANLLHHEAVTQVAVVVREDRTGDQRLVAYFVPDPDEDTTPTELRRFLRNQLPEYMIPQHFVELDRLPLTPNGKIDRRALPSPAEMGSAVARSEAPPVSATERLVAEIWRDLLGVPQVGLHDNFFDLGGHSLLSLRALSRIEERTNRRLPARLMVLQNLEQIAAELDRQMQ